MPRGPKGEKRPLDGAKGQGRASLARPRDGTDRLAPDSPQKPDSPAAFLALQLFFCFEVRALSGSLVSSTPE